MMELKQLRFGLIGPGGKLRRDEEGQGMVEYSLILAMMACACAGTLSSLGSDVQGVFTKASAVYRSAP